MDKIELLQSLQEALDTMNKLTIESNKCWREVIEKTKALEKKNEALIAENKALKAKIQEYWEFIFQLGKSNIMKV